jgi:serine/threonine-protein kinase
MQGVAIPLLKPGDKAGRYELLLQIAQGGMGAVWVARLKLENGFEKLFAVKTLLTHLQDQAVFRAMFLDEARIAASIEHPNVGQILDMGEQEDLLYLVMEWVEGESVNSLARSAATEGKKLPYGVILRMLADACNGLHAVHEHRDRDGRALEIVHRDVSPHNMLVSTRGVTKVIDFGVAKARDRLTGQTQSGAVKGKLRYMAPEQACGAPLDRRADVWGIGAVLYTLVAGRYPYAGETDVDVLRAMLAGKAPAPLPPAVPEPIDRVLRKALAVTPAERQPTAAQLAEDLDACARELGVPTSQHGVAAYIEQNAGVRLSKLRTAIHTAIEEREAVNSAIRRRSSPNLEGSISATTTMVDLDIPRPSTPGTDLQTQSGTLMGTTAFGTWVPNRVWSLQKSLAALAAVAVLGTLGVVIARATSDRSSIPSASASPPGDTIPPASANKAPEEAPPAPGIDLDRGQEGAPAPAPPLPQVAAPQPVVPAPAPAAPPVARAPDPPPVVRAPDPPPSRASTGDVPKSSAWTSPGTSTSSRSSSSSSSSRSSSSSSSTSSGSNNSSSSSGTTIPKKKPGFESAIDTRR